MKAKSAKRVMAAILAAVMGFSLVGCGGQDDGGKDSAQVEGEEKIPVKIAGLPYIYAMPFVYSAENGLYDNFDYTIDYYSSGPVQNEAIASGAWEVGVEGIGGVITGAAGYNLKTIAFTNSDTDVTDLWVRADSELAQIEPDEKGVRGTADDWRGKKILCPTGSSCHMLLIATLEHMGLTQDDVEIIDTAVAQSYAAFKAGEADVVALWSPFGFEAEEEGWVRVATVKDLGLEMPCAVVATEEAVENRPEMVQAWLETYLKSSEELAKNPEQTAQDFYEFEEEQGIAISEKTAQKEVEYRPFITLEQQKEYFAEEADGTSKAEKILLDYADFMISQGKMTEEDKQNMIENGFVDGSFIANIDEL